MTGLLWLLLAVLRALILCGEERDCGPLTLRPHQLAARKIGA